MKLHILGIAGTFMGGVAALARELGHAVDGSDQNVYPPMSTQLEAAGHHAVAGLRRRSTSPPTTDIVVVGNALSRGNAAVEARARRAVATTPRAREWLREQRAARPRHARGRRHARQDHDHLDPGLSAGSGRSRSGFPGRRRAGEFRRVRAPRRRPRVRGRSRRVRHRVLRQAHASSCTTGRRWRSSTTSNTTTPTSSRTWPRSSASSTIWCASCPATAA